MLIRAIALATFVAGMVSANAASADVVFSDDFNSYTPQLDWNPPSNWTIYATGGTVNLLGATSTGSIDPYPGAGGFVDLGSSNGTTGYMRTTQFFGPGTYTLTFDLAGNIAPTTTTFGIADAGLTTGDWMTAITLNSPSAFTPYTETFTTAGGYLWVFDSYASAPNIGNFLDNVSLTFDPPDPPPPPRTVTSVSVPIVPVPEPSTWVMLLLGFAALGYGGYRRGRNNRVASLLS